jgi:hypothetical protein
MKHRNSTQGQCLSQIRKAQNQRGRVRTTKVGEKDALWGWRESGCEERGLCHRYTSISLDREEPSRSPTPTTGIIVRYGELAKRRWLHALGGGASRLYKRSTFESDLESAESERHSSPDKNKKKRGGERFAERPRDAREGDL